MLEGEKLIAEARPQTFKYNGVAGARLNFVFNELTWKCKKQGYPDFAVLTLNYTPANAALELKSMKLWLNHYRDTYFGYEGITKEIFETIWEVAQPVYLHMSFKINPRGNVCCDIDIERYKDREAKAFNKEGGQQ